VGKGEVLVKKGKRENFGSRTYGRNAKRKRGESPQSEWEKKERREHMWCEGGDKYQRYKKGVKGRQITEKKRKG